MNVPSWRVGGNAQEIYTLKMAALHSSALCHLRAETGPLHDALEQDLQVVARLHSPPDRHALVEGYRIMMLRAAEAMEPWLASIDGLVPFHHAQGAAAALDRDEPAVPAMTSQAEILGFYYVMQGSALGGRVILRELQRDGVDTAGLGFLNPHGDRVGQVWRGTTELLERELVGDPAALVLAVAGARKGYAFAKACLQARITA